MQHTEDWFAQRRGRFTASRFADLMKNGGLEYSLDGKNFHSLPEFDEEKQTIEEAIFHAFGKNDFGFTIVNERKKDWVTHEKWGKDKYNPLVKTGFAGFVERVYETFGYSRKSMGETAKSYILQIAYETATGIPQGFDGNAATEWGNEHEEEARLYYEGVTGFQVDEIGFCSHPKNKYAGGSPDGLVGVEGIIEIKCPYNGINHARNIISGDFIDTYQWQCQGNLWVTGRKWCDLISYDPRLPGKRMHSIRIERDEEAIAKLAQRVDEAAELLTEYLYLLGYEEEQQIHDFL